MGQVRSRPAMKGHREDLQCFSTEIRQNAPNNFCFQNVCQNR